MCGNLGAVCKVGSLAQISGLYHWAVFSEETGVVAEMIGENFVEGAHDGKAFWSTRRLHNISIDGNSNGLGRGEDGGYIFEEAFFGLERNA